MCGNSGKGLGQMVLDRFLGDIESDGNFPGGKLLFPAQTVNLLTTAGQLVHDDLKIFLEHFFNDHIVFNGVDGKIVLFTKGASVHIQSFNFMLTVVIYYFVLGRFDKICLDIEIGIESDLPFPDGHECVMDDFLGNIGTWGKVHAKEI